ncbi:hypothetical protein ABVK25_009215 [Lepraria finkii]|uniref:Plasmid pRiA4b Orf3-like domain-containing protein n=1 Tax=Lepraria finkii TaxID=1340010 RepID=A0ABR4AY20_9LECA
MASTSAPTLPASRENYLFKITLKDIQGPLITRTLSCPEDATFHEFHQAIIISFNWGQTHEYNFQVFNDIAPSGTDSLRGIDYMSARPVAEFLRL